jgi:hypothetical protein
MRTHFLTNGGISNLKPETSVRESVAAQFTGVRVPTSVGLFVSRNGPAKAGTLTTLAGLD